MAKISSHKTPKIANLQKYTLAKFCATWLVAQGKLTPTTGHFKIEMNLSTMATLGTEESGQRNGHCRELAIVREVNGGTTVNLES